MNTFGLMERSTDTSMMSLTWSTKPLYRASIVDDKIRVALDRWHRQIKSPTAWKRNAIKRGLLYKGNREKYQTAHRMNIEVISPSS